MKFKYPNIPNAAVLHVYKQNPRKEEGKSINSRKLMETQKKKNREDDLVLLTFSRNMINDEFVRRRR